MQKMDGRKEKKKMKTQQHGSQQGRGRIRTSKEVVVQLQIRELGHFGNRVQGACNTGMDRGSKRKRQADQTNNK